MKIATPTIVISAIVISLLIIFSIKSILHPNLPKNDKDHTVQTLPFSDTGYTDEQIAAQNQEGYYNNLILKSGLTTCPISLNVPLPETSRIIFSESCSNDGSSELYSFNINTEKFSVMNISPIIHGYEASPDKKYFITLEPETTNLILVDLEKDIKKNIDSDTDTFTFTKIYSDFDGSPQADCTWKNDKEFSCNIFSTTTKTPRGAVDYRSYNVYDIEKSN